MSALDCQHEQDVVDAVLSGRWPHGCGEELRGHVATCSACREVTTITGLLREDQATSLSDVRVPAAGQIWWRAAIRARMEAAHTVSRPLTWMQGVAGAAIAGLAIALFGVVWPFVRAGMNWAGTLIGLINPGAADVAPLLHTAVQQALPLLLFAGAFVIITPIALYFALSEKNSERAK